LAIAAIGVGSIEERLGKTANALQEECRGSETSYADPESSSFSRRHSSIHFTTASGTDL
jgi:hypothetical protein